VALAIAASLEEDFLRLSGRPEASRESACSLEHALLNNSRLAGGVKVALSAKEDGLHLASDIVVLDEKQLLDRLRWALDGFHDGLRLLKSPASRFESAATKARVFETGLGQLLREVSWPSAKRGPNEYTAELDADSAPPAIIRMNESGVVLSAELVRAGAAAKQGQRALAVFLLTATGALRLVRAYAEEVENGLAFGIEVNLSPAPAMEEIDHALAALSIAHRMCARESNVLLDEAVARCYLAARET
jgi:hypothetical protein